MRKLVLGFCLLGASTVFASDQSPLRFGKMCEKEYHLLPRKNFPLIGHYPGQGILEDAFGDAHFFSFGENRGEDYNALWLNVRIKSDCEKPKEKQYRVSFSSEDEAFNAWKAEVEAQKKCLKNNVTDGVVLIINDDTSISFITKKECDDIN
jgi:hypothetical protein